MVRPLMPKATAVWLVENTSLTFEQIAKFCDLHILEVQGIADGEVAKGVTGLDPIGNGQLSREEIARCERDDNANLKLTDEAERHITVAKKAKKVGKYTPVARRNDKPDAIAWLLKNCPEINERQIGKLIGTTVNTIESIRLKTHWNSQNIKPRDPVLLGICTQAELDRVYDLAKKKAESVEARKKVDIKELLDKKEQEA